MWNEEVGKGTCGDGFEFETWYGFTIVCVFSRDTYMCISFFH